MIINASALGHEAQGGYLMNGRFETSGELVTGPEGRKRGSEAGLEGDN